MKSSITTIALQETLTQVCTLQSIIGLIKDASLGKVNAEVDGNSAVLTSTKASDITSLNLTQVGTKIVFTIAVHNGQVASVVTNDPEVLARWVVKFINLL